MDQQQYSDPSAASNNGQAGKWNHLLTFSDPFLF